MKFRFPLYAKILLWFFLNLLLLGVAAYVLARFQFRVGLDSLLAGQAGDRIEAVSRVISDELREQPREQWTATLARFNAAYGVKFVVFRPDGNHIAGEHIELPPPVKRRVMEVRPGPRPGTPQRQDTPLPPPPGGELERPRQPAGPRPPLPKFIVRTTKPTQYWLGVFLPGRDRNRPELPVQQHVLVIVSDTLRGGGLMFDYAPWILAGFGAVVLSVLWWLPLIRGITRSVSQMTAATEQVAEGRFDVRVDERRADELGRLGGAINRMTGRLNGFVTGQKRFLGDVAHELCSPLARIQVALGILEQRADEKQRGAVEDVREEVQHMSELVNELLSFTKAGLQEKELKLVTVKLAEAARRVIAREADGRAPIEIDENIIVLAEPDLLARALANLVRNALHYAGNVTLRAVVTGTTVTLTVSDTGPGVPEETLQQIFDPFFRVEASRSRDTGGIGLGLTIVKTCVQACEGTVTARNRQPSGLEVELTLKLVAAGTV
jgi:two-component system sensor histidine kinase CpxA